mgnify:FL=1
MRNSNKILVFLLVFSGIFAISNKDIVAAVKRAKAKRVIPKKKVNTVSSDATVTSRAGRTTTTTTTTSTTTAVDEDTEASLLAGNLKVCITSACDGDVAFEKCFKKGQAEYFVRADTTCKAMYDKASSDVVRLKAINNLNSTIKTYFNDACESAGGKVSGDVCKVKVCYVAKGEDTSDLKNCSDYKIGQSFTCSYTAFGFSDQDMEYKTKMTTEQLGQVINGIMGVAQGALSTTVSIVDAVSASKELKAKNDIKGKECYGIWSYGSNTLSITPSSNCKKTWTKEENKKACTDIKNKICKTDTYGNWYEETDNNPSSGDKSYTALTDKNKSCDTVDVSNWGASSSNGKISECYVELSEYTELTKAEKEAELYKKFTDFDSLKFEDQINNIGKAAYLSDQFGLNDNTSSDKYSFTFYTSTADDFTCKTAVSTGEHKNDEVNSESCKKVSSSANNCGVYGTSSYNECIKTQRYIVNCSCDYKNTASKKGFQYDKNNKGSYAEQVKEYYGDMSSGLKTFTTNNYSSAVSTYNSKMKSVNEKKDEITELKSRKSSGIVNAIATGSSTLVTQGANLTTTLISVDKNKGVRTGACYLGDPSSGGIYFAPENSRKTLSWKNL